ALDVYALLDALGIQTVRVLGLSGGGITALHMAAIQPDRVTAMVVVSAPARFPEQARAIQRNFSAEMVAPDELKRMRERHPRPGQLDRLFAQTRAFASGDDPNFAADDLRRISARTLIVFGDRDFLYPVEMAHDLARDIPHSSLWIVAGGGHGPVFGDAAPR